jgi:hypothetical protein
MVSLGQVNLTEGFIRLLPEDAQTNEGRLISLNRKFIEMFKTMPTEAHGNQ